VEALVCGPRTFAYPHGSFDERAVAAVTSLGLAGWTTRHGRSRLGDAPGSRPRIEVTAATTSRALASAVLFDRRCRGGL